MTEAILEGTDLELAMSPRQAATLGQRFGGLSDKVHVLPEYAMGAPDQEGILDPYGQTMTAFRTSLRQLLEHVVERLGWGGGTGELRGFAAGVRLQSRPIRGVGPAARRLRWAFGLLAAPLALLLALPDGLLRLSGARPEHLPRAAVRGLCTLPVGSGEKEKMIFRPAAVPSVSVTAAPQEYRTGEPAGARL